MDPRSIGVERELFSGNRMRVAGALVRWPDGHEDEVAIATLGRGHGVMVLAVRGLMSSDPQIALVSQWRVAAGHHVLEFPGGAVDDAESALAAARREAGEELGADCAAAPGSVIGQIRPHPALRNVTDVVLLELDAIPTGPEHVEPESGAMHMWVTFEELRTLIRTGRVRDGVTLGAFMLFTAYRG